MNKFKKTVMTRKETTMSKKPILEAMDEVLDWACDEAENNASVDLKDASVQLVKLTVKKLVEKAQIAVEEIQDYEGGRMDPKDFLDNMHSNWLNLVQQMDVLHTRLDSLGVDLANTTLFTRKWK